MRLGFSRPDSLKLMKNKFPEIYSQYEAMEKLGWNIGYGESEAEDEKFTFRLEITVSRKGERDVFIKTLQDLNKLDSKDS